MLGELGDYDAKGLGERGVGKVGGRGPFFML